jgi:uncharacterized BrkB/YihY/UPF0761 family membrane protein
VYSVLIITHNIVRWIVLITALFALFRAYRGWIANKAWEGMDRTAGMAFAIAFDVQVLLGILLLFISPLLSAIVRNPQAAMKIDELRVIVEHIPMMLIALVLLHATTALAKKAPDDRKKHRRAAIGYTLTFVFILLAIPWNRALFPGIG